MNEKRITRVIHEYKAELRSRGIAEKELDDRKTFAEASTEERLSHALWLLGKIEKLVGSKGSENAVGRYYGSVQIILSFEGFFKLREIRNHNRSGF